MNRKFGFINISFDHEHYEWKIIMFGTKFCGLEIELISANEAAYTIRRERRREEEEEEEEKGREGRGRGGGREGRGNREGGKWMSKEERVTRHACASCCAHIYSLSVPLVEV